MLAELAVENLGIVERLDLVLGEGMTAVTGETGAGKTLLVEAIELLVGGRADVGRVRPGASEARVEGRFVVGDEELILARVVPAEGRSRAYLDGRLATAATLAERGAELVDLHGQHAHQSLLAAATQRDALDRFGAVDLGPLRATEANLAALDAELAGTGGDARARAREADLLAYQLGEIDDVGVDDPDEEAALVAEEAVLAGAADHRDAARLAGRLLGAERGARDLAAEALRAIDGRAPFAEPAERLRSAVTELAELAADLRHAAERIDEDPERLAAVQARRRRLGQLRRKYGATLADVLAFRAETEARLAELRSWDARAAELERRRAEALAARAAARAAVGEARRRAAVPLAEAVAAHLGELALPRARLEVDVAGDAGEVVTFRFAANPGEPTAPLAKVASGGELARVMLALRLVLGGSPPTLVFDEVDAGIGGRAALAVGRSLGELGRSRQVLVVTHLPQVAAFADHQVVVAKGDAGGRTVASARPVVGPERVAELARMLAGMEGSGTARRHAEELLAAARRGLGP